MKLKLKEAEHKEQTIYICKLKQGSILGEDNGEDEDKRLDEYLMENSKSVGLKEIYKMPEKYEREGSHGFMSKNLCTSASYARHGIR